MIKEIPILNSNYIGFEFYCDLKRHNKNYETDFYYYEEKNINDAIKEAKKSG